MATQTQPIQNPLPSGIGRPTNALGCEPRFVHPLDVLVLDQVKSWGWDDMLFVECGDGWAAEEAWRRRRNRGHVVALDMSPGAIELANRLRGIAGQVEFATWDGRHLRHANGLFDQVISSFALQHSPDPEALAREMVRVLRPHGELYAAEPESRAEETRNLLTLAGFSEIEELARFHHQVDGAAEVESAVVIHARAIE